MYAGVELGGTKCVCILGTGPADIRGQEAVPTTDPVTTLGAIARVLERWQMMAGKFAAIGIASFGPIDLRRDSRSYGHVGNTPKALWAGVDLAGFFSTHFAVPVGLSTDVIGAALAEGRWGAARGLNDYAYITVGTGVGVGMVVGGRTLSGRHHPELGHVRVVRATGDEWPGSCRFHGACVEGLASGTAIEARSGTSAANVPEDSPIWESVAHALAQLAHILALSVAPQRILIGGGVIGARPHLFPQIRAHFTTSLNGYLDMPELASGQEPYIGPPGLGAHAGPLGALALALDAAADPSNRRVSSAAVAPDAQTG
jgi:fructokinase